MDVLAVSSGNGPCTMLPESLVASMIASLVGIRWDFGSVKDLRLFLGWRVMCTKGLFHE